MRILLTSSSLPDRLPANADVVHVPVLTAQVLPLPALPPTFEAVVYSRNGVTSLENQVEGKRITRIVAVGEKTRAAAQAAFPGVEVIAPDSENFEGVVDFLRDRSPASVRVSFELADGPRSLAESLDNTISVPAYKTTALDTPALRQVAQGHFDWVVFASPRAVEAVLAADMLEHPRIAAIGPTTAASLREHGVEPDLVAAVPDLAELLQAVALTADA